MRRYDYWIAQIIGTRPRQKMVKPLPKPATIIRVPDGPSISKITMKDI